MTGGAGIPAMVRESDVRSLSDDVDVVVIGFGSCAPNFFLVQGLFLTSERAWAGVPR
jgi:hypothetical protein